MKSAFAMFIALVAMAGLVSAQTTENFDGATTGSTAAFACASSGGWTYPTGFGEDANACGAGPLAWRPDAGGTGSTGTGPSDDRTGGGNYMYCETSGPAGGTEFHLTMFTNGPAGSMDFWYNLNGAGIGSLDVEVNGVNAFNVSGDMGDNWINSGAIALPAGNACVRFIYTHGSSFTGDAAIDDVTVPGTFVFVPVNANSSEASLDINGTTAFAGCGGQPVSVNFSSSSVGLPFDIGIGPIAACPIPLIDDTVELDLAASVSLFGGPIAAPHPIVGFGLGNGNMSFNFGAVPGTANLQGGAFAPTDPDGVAYTEVVTYDVIAAQSTIVTALGDDDSVNIGLGNVGPACFPGAPVNFYGTVYNDFHISSNGDITFTAGSTDFTATSGEWMANMPRVGFAGDLEPNNFGTITAVALADGFRVDYTNVTEWGTTGMGVTSYSVEVSTSAGAAITGFTTDGTWGATATVMGISNGMLGTHPGVVSFDTLFTGSGGVGAALATDSWIDENTAGIIPGAGGAWSNVSFPTADGSSILVN